MKIVWLLDEKTLLKGLWDQGLTVRQIEERMEGRSQCSIIGQAHRMGLSRRPNPIKNGRPAKPKVLIKRHCMNPECGIEITGIGGHKDRMYCTQACSNKMCRERAALDKELSPKIIKTKPVQCTHRDAKERRCTYLALPGQHSCYGDLHAL